MGAAYGYVVNFLHSEINARHIPLSNNPEITYNLWWLQDVYLNLEGQDVQDHMQSTASIRNSQLPVSAQAKEPWNRTRNQRLHCGCEADCDSA